MTTGRDIVTAALEDVGVVGLGQTPTGEDMNFGLVRLNRMIAQFNRRRWLIFHLVDIACIATGNTTYTVGVGGDFSIARPDKIEDGCYFYQNTGAGINGGGDDFSNDENSDFGPVSGLPGTPRVRYPLGLVEAHETWNTLTIPNLTTWPSDVFYDPTFNLGPPGPGNQPGFPMGTLRIYPVPAAGAYELHILVKDALQTLSNPSAILMMPAEYEEALEYNLALRFCAKYQIEASKEVSGLARASLSTLRSANTKVPLLKMPNKLARRGGRYNIFSDRSN